MLAAEKKERFGNGELQLGDACERTCGFTSSRGGFSPRCGLVDSPDWSGADRTLFFLRFACHLDEADRQNHALGELTILFLEQMQLLIDPVADRNDHTAAVFELLRKRLRNFVRRAGDDDGVERRDFGPTLITVG